MSSAIAPEWQRSLDEWSQHMAGAAQYLAQYLAPCLRTAQARLLQATQAPTETGRDAVKKAELAALVNSLRAALDATMLRCVAAERDAQHAEMEKQAAFHQLRELQEQRLAAPVPPSVIGQRYHFEDKICRPVRDGETPDVLISDVREGKIAQGLPYVIVRHHRE